MPFILSTLLAILGDTIALPCGSWFVCPSWRRPALCMTLKRPPLHSALANRTRELNWGAHRREAHEQGAWPRGVGPYQQGERAVTKLSVPASLDSILYPQGPGE